MEKNVSAIYKGKPIGKSVLKDRMYKIDLSERSVALVVGDMLITRTYDTAEDLLDEWELVDGKTCTCCGGQSESLLYCYISEGLLGKNVHYLCRKCFAVHKKSAQMDPEGPPEGLMAKRCEDLVEYFMAPDGTVTETLHRRCTTGTVSKRTVSWNWTINGKRTRVGEDDLGVKVMHVKNGYRMYFLASEASLDAFKEHVTLYLDSKMAELEASMERYLYWKRRFEEAV